ncbi:DHA2 family efflux MFS transporter permease subunit [Phorcysia thermohydrogeniphila]|uniref:DHA2 family multidrug resistance protein n=1 Tax=Phorcysia thermohydrogeniphila TaxID=936138 RepID=A0A4R1GEP2_9BACT|nr:DHA2 family efflux MFS transporter permease subunit [Phorcysia thermohydrogeniphila]TCK06448.1 DHA2 family multidrug resistance protein [Phorcysia thermohydrogeniphila]
MERRLIVISVLIVAGMFMTLLDTTIVDIVLPHMMSAFEAEPDDIQWVITSYMIASAVAMPVVGWLGGKLGHRNTYLLGIALFTVMSAVCGIAPNLETMIAGRVLQGVGEGIAVPMTMTLLFELYPPEKRGMAMGMFALGATFGPSLGPTLGGYLSEHLSWRWVFYVNLLPGVLVIYLLMLLMKDDRKEHRGDEKLDVIGFALLSVSLASLITALSKGNDWGWSDERTVVLLYVAAVTAILFIYYELRTGNPLVNLELFRYRFFSFPVLSLALFGMGVYASYFLLPLYLEKLRGFPTVDAGEILFFPAATTGIVSLIVGFLLDRKLLSYKTSIIVGILVFTLGTYIQSRLDLDMSKTQIILLLLPWGAGMGFFFPALSQISLGNFQGELLRQASALQNLLRLVGGSVGTAISTYILISSQSGHLLRMGEKVSPYSPQVTEFLSGWKQFLYYARSTAEGLLSVKAKAVMGMLFQKAAYWHSFGDAFFFATICGILTLIPALLIGKTFEGVKS